MIIKKTDGALEIIEQHERENAYSVLRGTNGKPYVDRKTVDSCLLHVSEGNSKTGPAINFNFPIEYTCDHRCECYKLGICYACQGCYSFSNNQAMYSENYNFYKASTCVQFINALQLAIDQTGYKLFRYFTCGDIPDQRFIDCMVRLAEKNPDVRFWSYTKKYGLVNAWIDQHGQLPENLVILFSHWMNNDGSYFPMENPHKLPTSEFIPLGQEHLKEHVTHICPCSDPTVNATCATCDHACYKLRHGESMALLEHSTKQTRQRDKEIKQAKQALKKGA